MQSKTQTGGFAKKAPFADAIRKRPATASQDHLLGRLLSEGLPNYLLDEPPNFARFRAKRKGTNNQKGSTERWNEKRKENRTKGGKEGRIERKRGGGTTSALAEGPTAAI